MGAGQQYLRATRVEQHIQYQSANPVPATVRLPGNLLAHRNDALGVAEVDNDVPPVDPLDDAVDDFTLAVDEVCIYGISFSIFHFLNDYLFG